MLHPLSALSTVNIAMAFLMCWKASDNILVVNMHGGEAFFNLQSSPFPLLFVYLTTLDPH